MIAVIGHHSPSTSHLFNRVLAVFVDFKVLVFNYAHHTSESAALVAGCACWQCVGEEVWK